MNTTRLLALPALLALAGASAAQTVTVNTTADVIDINSFTGTLADLPGPDGLISLSEAMIATNNTPGHQTVEFAIPASQLGWCCSQFNGIAVFHSVVGFYWRANDEVTIDGTSQTAFAGDTNPNGAEVLLYGKTFYLNEANSILRGFHATSIDASGANCLLEDNTGGSHLTLFAGGGSVVRNNDCGTIKIDRSNGNLVIGNRMDRVRILGGGSNQLALDNRVGGPSLAERNFLTGYGTWNSEGHPAGATIQLAWTRGTTIENNRIGTTPDGLAQGNAASTMGISLETENHDLTVRDNLIAGILGKGMGPHHAGQLFGWAIYFWGSTTNVLIEDNTIGLDANGDPTLGSVWGVNVDNFSGYSVNGVSLIGNTIAGHIFDGVRVGPTADMRLSRNSIYDNGWLGIDLIPSNFASGVSPNDPLDTDSGGSGVQNFPDIASAAFEGAGLRINGVLSSSANDDFVLEFFASSACDGSGFGEGELYLGSTPVTTDGSGFASFSVLVPVAPPTGWYVTATATLEPLGATSEFSGCVQIGSNPIATYCTAKINSQGCVPQIGFSGTLSMGDASPFLVTAQNVLNSMNGLFFYGKSGQASIPFQGGTLCFNSPVTRTTAQNSGGGLPPGANCSGGYQLDFDAWFASGIDVGLQLGAVVAGQYWSRDPLSTFGAGLTNAIEFTVTP